MMELHEAGEVGEVIALNHPFIVVGTDLSRHYKELVIETESTKFLCHPNFYLLGYKLWVPPSKAHQYNASRTKKHRNSK